MDDIIAQDFFDNPGEWPRKRKIMTDLLAANKCRANKFLAHLTYTRTRARKAGRINWGIGCIANDLSPAFKSFLDFVPEHRLSDALKELRPRFKLNDLKEK